MVNWLYRTLLAATAVGGVFGLVLPATAETIAVEFGGRVVVKAQIHAGGRGKGGGIKGAADAAVAARVAGDILGMQLVTHQTGPEGQTVKQVLVEAAVRVL